MNVSVMFCNVFRFIVALFGAFGERSSVWVSHICIINLVPRNGSIHASGAMAFWSFNRV